MRQIVFALVVSLANAVAVLSLHPYVLFSDNIVSIVAQWVLFLQVLAGLLVRVQQDQAALATALGTAGNTSRMGGALNETVMAYVCLLLCM